MSLPLTVIKEIARNQGNDSTDTWEVSILDPYWARPEQAPFTDMCLAEFAAQFGMRSYAVKKKVMDSSDQIQKNRFQ